MIDKVAALTTLAAISSFNIVSTMFSFLGSKPIDLGSVISTAEAVDMASNKIVEKNPGMSLFCIRDKFQKFTPAEVKADISSK